MDRKRKEEVRVEFSQKFAGTTATFVAEYRGMTVGELTDLRRDLRKSKSEFRVFKNRIAKKAFEHEIKDGKGLSDRLKGPVGLVLVKGDAAAAAKSMLEFTKTHPLFVVTGGLLDNKVVSVEDIKALSSLPSREVLLGRIVGSLVSPHRGILGVLTGVQRNLVYALAAIRDQKKA